MPPSSPRRGLSPEVILDAALDLVDRHGLDGLTMRNLGAHLGTDPMAVYGHFADKAALFDALVDREAIRTRQLPEPLPDDPVERLVRIALHHRDALLAHPHLAPLAAARPLPREMWAEVLTTGIDRLRATGFTDDDIPVVATCLGRFVLGHVVHEAGEAAQRAGTGEDTDAYHRRLVDGLRGPDERAALSRRVVQVALDPDGSRAAFEVGVRALVHGLLAGAGRPAGDVPSGCRPRGHEREGTRVGRP